MLLHCCLPERQYHCFAGYDYSTWNARHGVQVISSIRDFIRHVGMSKMPCKRRCLYNSGI